ncbi:MAG: aldo/keto reductase [Betaproteobacteria bacterium]|nr:aldo/keto reductase [Betaproteobacteria bacterium]
MNPINVKYPHNRARRQLLALGAGLAGAALLPAAYAQSGAKPALLTRAVPKTGEKLGVVGLGTQFVLDIGADTEKRAGRIGVIRTLLDAGGSVIDAAPSYGPAEATLGDLLTEMKARERAFIATKFRAAGREGAIAEMKESQRRLRSEKIELMLRHNIGFVPRAEADTHLALAREWKAQGLCKYIGVTHSQNQAKANARLIEMLQTEKLDFIQVNYSMAERSVEDKLLAVAADTGTAVMCNLPYARGALFRAVQGKAVPEWAQEFDAPTWGQFFLKYLIAHPSVNVVIPGTDRVEHMVDNLDAGRTRLPNAAQRKRMVEFIGAV